jgi:hypothetical protein
MNLQPRRLKRPLEGVTSICRYIDMCQCSEQFDRLYSRSIRQTKTT